MFLIVWYHIISYYMYLLPHSTSLDNLIEAIIPSIHIGVLLFLLITGYYGIKPSIKGFLRLLLIVAVYYLPLQLLDLGMIDGFQHPKRILQTFQFVSNTPYWFIRTYLFLYVLSPIINTFILYASRRIINLMLVALGIISVYFGTMQGDPSLCDGKNIVNFIFLYLLGHSINHYQLHWQKIKGVYLIIAYLMINASLILLLLYFPRTCVLGAYIWRYSFLYCSPILLFNAVIVFLFFSKLSFQSEIVNSIAASTFAIYLVHCQPYIHKELIMPLVRSASSNTPPAIYLLAFAALAVAIMILCGIIDKILSPLWKINNNICNKIQDMILSKWVN